MPDLPDEPTPAERDMNEVIIGLLAVLDETRLTPAQQARVELLRARHDALRGLLGG